MPAGRPLKFKTVELNDELVKTNDFEREKDLELFIVNNIDNFVTELLEDELISFEVDKPLEIQHFSPRGRRVDLYIVGKIKNYIIELKNPNFGTESRASIGQILDYGREFLDPKKELIIITTKFDINTAKTIKYYNLPIRYIFIDKSKMLEFKEYKND